MAKKKKAKKIKKGKTLKKTKNKIKTKIDLKIPEKKLTSSGPDEKPIIVKVKKQATEKKNYNLKDYVVYPSRGVGQILEIVKIPIAGIEVQSYKIILEKDKSFLMVPINQQKRLRPISSINQINKCVAILKTKPKIKRTMWSRRAQEYDQKINSGKIYELAEVVKDLNKNTDIIADQSYSERQLFEKAYERLKAEFEAVLKISPEDVQKKMDKALGRTNISQDVQ
tara:strand:- start:86 stop:760 length:675 start_codon:yes stop_codon:yes gene_type:complete